MTRSFDPNAAATGRGIFGLPHSPESAEAVLIPVPWEATVSYRAGTAKGPEAILRASSQLDLLDRETGTPYERGIAMLPADPDLREMSRRGRDAALPVIEAGGPGEDPDLRAAAERVNALCEEMNARVHRSARTWLDRGKLVGVVGGDHSVAFGMIRAAVEDHPGLGILHLDAHCDLRIAYEGFTWSHASIMHNVLRLLPVSCLVQVGIRDFAPQEQEQIEAEPGRIAVFHDPDLRYRLQSGEAWNTLAAEIVDRLPETVYLSFDIDGLDPTLCPGTGTPVPGGLSFSEATSLLRAVRDSGRRIVGMDLCEVAPRPPGTDEWDGNVGARLLYKMIGFALQTRGEEPAAG